MTENQGADASEDDCVFPGQDQDRLNFIAGADTKTCVDYPIPSINDQSDAEILDGKGDHVNERYYDPIEPDWSNIRGNG